MKAKIIQLVPPCRFVPKGKPIRVWSPLNKAHKLSHNAVAYFLVNRIDSVWIPSIEVHKVNSVSGKVFNNSKEELHNYYPLTEWTDHFVTVRALEIINGMPLRVFVEYALANEFVEVHEVKSKPEE